MKSKSKALVYTECQKQHALEQFISSEIPQLRFGNNIAERLTKIFQYLECGGWDSLLAELKNIKTNTTAYFAERDC